MSKRQPKPLTKQEREDVANYFEGMSKELDILHNKCKGMATAYPGLKANETFVNLWRCAEEGTEYARAFADYIQVATDEHWEKESE